MKPYIVNHDGPKYISRYPMGYHERLPISVLGGYLVTGFRVSGNSGVSDIAGVVSVSFPQRKKVDLQAKDT